MRHLPSSFHALAMLALVCAPQMAYAQAVAPPPVAAPAPAGGTPAGAATAPATAGAAVPGQPAPPPVPVKEPVPISIFFTAEELQRMRAAIMAYEKSKLVKISKAEDKANDFLNQLTDSEPAPPPEPVEKTYVYPQFFLNSLVYHSKEDWVVLINGQRYSSRVEQTDPEIRVLGVDEEKVVLEWKPKKMDRVMESWAKNINEEINVDPVVGIVSFTLRPNQTFSSYAMRVLEGRVRPVMVVFKTDEPALPPDEEGKATEELKKPENITTEDIKNNVGVKGLDKTYKRIGLE